MDSTINNSNREKGVMDLNVLLVEKRFNIITHSVNHSTAQTIKDAFQQSTSNGLHVDSLISLWTCGMVSAHKVSV